jgi:cobalt-zinc-cadmium efflux system membrane fusion protein
MSRFQVVISVGIALIAVMMAACSSHDDSQGRPNQERAREVAKPGGAATLDHGHGDDDHDDRDHDHRHGEEDGHDHRHANAEHAGDAHDHEDELRQTRIPAAMAARVGIRVEPVIASSIGDVVRLQGLLMPVDGKVARVSARFPGPVRAVHVQVGDSVRAGQRLATVDSNLSLSRYDIVAPINGTVLRRQVSVGDLAENQVLFELADLSELWADLHLFGAAAERATTGLPVRIERLSDGASVEAELERILPGAATVSQSTVARARLANGDGRWRPGMAVRAVLTLDARAVQRSVPASALQRLDRDDVVFVQTGDLYQARTVELGQRDGGRVEILSGVDVGDRVVVEQSFLVKADIEKAGAAHEH